MKKTQSNLKEKKLSKLGFKIWKKAEKVIQEVMDFYQKDLRDMCQIFGPLIIKNQKI